MKDLLKKITKNILNGFIVACMAAPLTVHAKTKVVIKADKDYPPYSFVKDGKIVGIYTDILREAFGKMSDYDVMIEAVPWKKGLAEVKDGDTFGLFPPYYHVKKRPYIYPYSLPILDESLALICSDKGMKKITKKPNMMWPADFSGIHVGINRGFTVPRLDGAKKAKKIKVTEVTNNVKNLNKLSLGRIDCVINDYLSIAYALKSEKEAGKIAKDFNINKTHIISKEQGFVGFATKAAKFPFKDDFIKALNIEIYELNRQGRIQEISDKYTGQ